MTDGIRWKAIVPRIPSKKLSYEKIRAGLRRFSTLTKQQYRRTTKTWSKKPEVSTEESIVGDIARVRAHMDDMVWTAIDEGVPGKIIVPVNADSLVFVAPTSPKTSPGLLDASGGSSSGHSIKTQKVDWPGIKARNFTDNIAEELEDSWYKICDDIVNGLSIDL